MVAMAAAIGTAENQNEPVTKTFFAPSRNASLPSTAARARPFAIALLQADRSGSHPDRLPAGPEVQPEPGSDVVQDQRGPVLVAQGAEPAGEGGVDQLLVEAGVVLERADQDPGQVIAGLGGGRAARWPGR